MSILLITGIPDTFVTQQKKATVMAARFTIIMLLNGFRSND